MQFVVSPPRIPSLSVVGLTGRFPVNRIYCVGRNYAAHALEMGKDPERERPFFFMKPASAAVDAAADNVEIPYPQKTENFQHEVELVVAIGTAGESIAPERALDCVFGYAVGLDMTRRDLQLEARSKGRPWEFGKSFANSAPMGPIHRAVYTGHLRDAPISLTVNGSKRQSSSTSKLIWSVAECISYLSQYDSLQPGDLIMTGTPEGVGSVERGDVLRGEVAGLGAVVVRVAG